ncbi:MAG TPA: hypothetical protein VFN78_00185 [Ktedonobacterales bacterium]|nr:hypothetical protein [Ktedonobacterales bacterium]
MRHDEPLALGAVRSFGAAPVDAALRDVVGAYERAFPGRVRGYYALGSFADASAIATSDLDITIVFKGSLSAGERASAQRLGADCARRSSIELDVEIKDELTLARGASPNFKLGSALIAGEDIRGRIPLVSLTEWTRDRMHSSWWRVARLFARPPIIALPLDYPEPADQFRGYTRRTVRLASGAEAPSTRDLIRLTGWAATALLALQCGSYVTRKSEVHRLYRERIGGDWAQLIEEIYTLCRARWGYLVPGDPDERARLRDLCDRTLAFERSFVSTYRAYLLNELQGSDVEGVRFAAEVMNRAPLRDDAVLATLESLAQRGDVVAEPLVCSALARLRQSENA